MEPQIKIEDLSDNELIKRIKYLSSHERILKTKVLKYLWEMNRRRLYSDLGHRSSFDFLVKELSYSEQQAWQHINGMTFLKNMPNSSSKIEQGSLNLGNINLLNRFFKNSGISNKKEKEEIMNKIENCSTSQCEKILSEIAKNKGNQNPFQKTIIKRTDADTHRLHVCLKEDAINKMNSIRGYLAHQGHKEINQLLEYIIEVVYLILSERNSPTKVPFTTQTSSKNISEAIKKEVWRRANGKCQKCSSTFALQIDHITPKARGGTNYIDNLRLLCRSCNQREAIRILGQKKMDKYL